jgi:DNA-binding transcriptional regulator of glucitol operon
MEKGSKKFTKSKRRKRNTDPMQQQTSLPPIQEVEEPMSSRAIEADDED